MPVRHRIVRLALVGCSLAACGAGPADAPASPTAERIVALGDLHGDLAQALAAMRLAGLVDAGGHWSGGTTTFVQTGDTVDRGPQSKEVLDLMMRLQGEAEAAGGRVVALLGNHEVMNLHGDWRYVSPADVAGFGGQAARVAAFALDGTYGGWLAERDAVARVGDAVFVHGGLTPAWAARGVAGINAEVHEALRHPDRAVLGVDGPLWYRGFVADPERVACADLERSLETLGASRMVVGHTTQRSGRIGVRCDGRLHVIDVGISAAYGGHLAAWELTGHDARALYPTGPVDLEDPAP